MADVQPDLAVYKILTPDQHARLQANGSFDGSPADKADGFIHFSRKNQIEGTLVRHYADHTDLQLLEVATAGLIDFMRWEESRGGELFPHLYGNFAQDDVRREWVIRNVNGTWELPDDL